MTEQEAKDKATEILTKAGYKINGTIVTEPEFDFGYVGIAVQDKLSDEILFTNWNGNEATYQVEMINSKLKIVEVEV